MRKDRDHQEEPADPVAGNGILNRRVFLERALLSGVAGAAVAGSGGPDAWAEPLPVPPWMKQPGAQFTA